MKFRPLHDRVVVRRIDAEEKTKGGIKSDSTKGHGGYNEDHEYFGELANI